MTESTLHILMTGGGAPGAAGILHCLALEKNVRVVVADADAGVGARYTQYPFEVIPRGDDPAFASVVANICQRHRINLILPLVTRELLPLSLHQSAFEKMGVKVIVSPPASLEIANNKSRLYQFLQWRGMAVPDFRVVETVEQFKTAIAELGYPGKPVCFKPSVSNGSRGFRILTEQINEADLLFHQKPTMAYMRAPEAIRILSLQPFPELLVSEYLPGEEYSVDCLADKGEAILVIPRLRKRMVNGISTEGLIEEQPEIISYCRQLIRELQLHGNIGIQVKAAADGAYRLLEINPRVQGSIAACLGAGINLPVLAIQQERGQLPPRDTLKVKWGVRFSKHWEINFY